jgi:peptide-methionine (S)-S-oxide reductase
MRCLVSILLCTALFACTGTDAEEGESNRSRASRSSGDSDSTANHTEAPAGVDPHMTADSKPTDTNAAQPTPAKQEVATFGAGCFWCVEAVLERLSGVIDVTSGYTGGTVTNPTYKQVCSGDTGHAEVVQVTFDPSVITYDELLDWFWRLHDPTTLNRQGADEGTQYRSAIFYHSEAQRERAEKSKQARDKSGQYLSPIVTEITAAPTFYPAEEGHQDYFRLNSRAGYCRMVIAPKLEKLGIDK